MDHYKYKFKGIFFPYLMQTVVLIFLIIFWSLLIRSGPNIIALIVSVVINLVIIKIFYFSYPARFELSSTGMRLIFSFGNSLFVPWENINEFKITAFIGIIVIKQESRLSRIVNKYCVVLGLLFDGQRFKQILKDKTDKL